MKKSTKFLLGILVFAAFSIGFIIGITVNYPKVETSELAGTIGKVNNYRNVKISEEDIQLRNKLLTDSVKLNGYIQYLNYYYLFSAKMSGDIDFAIKASEGNNDFKVNYQTYIDDIQNFKEFLDESRPGILLALNAVKGISKDKEVAVQALLNKASNVIMHLSYREQVIIDFINAIDAFVLENENSECKSLKRAHDALFVNEINSSIVSSNKLLQKALDKKAFLGAKNDVTVNKELFDALVKKDMEKLNVVMDSEQLGMVHDAEQLKVFDIEQLGYVVPDVEKLNGCWDMEQLGAWDSEKLNLMPDKEQLKMFMDAEQLGTFMDAEQLGMFMDIEELGRGTTGMFLNYLDLHSFHI